MNTDHSGVIRRPKTAREIAQEEQAAAEHQQLVEEMAGRAPRRTTQRIPRYPRGTKQQ